MNTMVHLLWLGDRVSYELVNDWPVHGGRMI